MLISTFFTLYVKSRRNHERGRRVGKVRSIIDRSLRLRERCVAFVGCELDFFEEHDRGVVHYNGSLSGMHYLGAN